MDRADGLRRQFSSRLSDRHRIRSLPCLPGARRGGLQSFANQYAPWLGSISLILFTFLGAMWLARFVKTDIEHHGLALGVIVSLVNLIFEGTGAFSLVAMTTTVLFIAGGWRPERTR